MSQPKVATRSLGETSQSVHLILKLKIQTNVMKLQNYL